MLGTFSSLLNYPASAVAEKNQMVFVEPAGGAPNMFTRGFKYLFFAQPATAPHQADVFVNYIKSLPADQRPKTAAYPTQDDPFAAPVIESMQKQLEALGVKTVYSQTYPADTTNFQSIASQLAAKKPDLIAQGAVFEDGVGLVRSLKQLNYSPKMLFQTSAPSNAGQYSERDRDRQHRGRLLHGQLEPGRQDPAEPGVRHGLPGRVQGRRPGRGRGRRLRHGAGAAGGGRAKVGSIDQTKIRDWLHANEVQTILGPLSWTDKGEPQGQFLLAQWQSSKVQVVAPPEPRRPDRRQPEARLEVELDMAQLSRPWSSGLLIGGVYALMASGPDADLRGHEDHQHRPGRVPHPGRDGHLVAVAGDRHRPDPRLGDHDADDVRLRLGALPHGGLPDPRAVTVDVGAAHVRDRPGHRGHPEHHGRQQVQVRDPGLLRGVVPVGSIALPKPQVYGFLAAVVVLAGALRRADPHLDRAGRSGPRRRTRPAPRWSGSAPPATAALAFALGTSTAGVGGSILSVLYPFFPASHYDWISRLLGIIVLGGMGSLPGALVGALVLGLAETLTATYGSLRWSTLVFYLVILVVLLFRPQGLYGTRLREDGVAREQLRVTALPRVRGCRGCRARTCVAALVLLAALLYPVVNPGARTTRRRAA